MSAVSLRRFVGTALASLALVTAACGDSDSTGPGSDPVPADVSGTYQLTGLRTLSSSIHGGGNALPITFTDPKGTTLVFKSGELVLAAPDSKTYRQLAAARVFTATTRPLPALAEGRLYVRDTQTLKCLDVGRKGNK